MQVKRKMFRLKPTRLRLPAAFKSVVVELVSTRSPSRAIPSFEVAGVVMGFAFGLAGFDVLAVPQAAT